MDVTIKDNGNSYSVSVFGLNLELIKKEKDKPISIKSAVKYGTKMRGRYRKLADHSWSAFKGFSVNTLELIKFAKGKGLLIGLKTKSYYITIQKAMDILIKENRAMRMKSRGRTKVYQMINGL